MATAAPADYTEPTSAPSTSPTREPWQCDRSSGVIVKLDEETTGLLERLARSCHATPDIVLSLSVKRAANYFGIR